MNDYITLDGKKYRTPAKFWTPYEDKPATVRKTLLGATDVTYGPAVFNEWHGQIAGPVTPDNDGVCQVETATAVGMVTVGGDVNIYITAAALVDFGGVAEFDITIGSGQTASMWAATVRAALAADPALTSAFAVSGTGQSIVLTAKVAAVNDPTLNIAITHGTTTGITDTPTSANTTAGVGTTYGTILDLRTTLAKLEALAFTDHYGASMNVHVLGPFQERSLTPKWDSPSNTIYVTVRLVKA